MVVSGFWLSIGKFLRYFYWTYITDVEPNPVTDQISKDDGNSTTQTELKKVTKNVDVESINNTLLKKNTKHNDKHSDGEYDNHTERMNIPSKISFLEDD